MIFPIEFSFILTMISIVTLILYTLSGRREGFILKGIELLSTIICIILAWNLSGKLSTSIQILPKSYSLFTDTILDASIYTILNQFLLFFILFILSRILIKLIRPIFKTINWIPFVGSINRILGAILGFIQGFIMIVVFSFLLSSPLFVNGDEVLKKSHLSMTGDIYRSIMHTFSGNFDRIESIKKVITPSSELKDSDINNVQSWLKEQGFSEEEQEEVINLINYRNGK